MLTLVSFGLLALVAASPIHLVDRDACTDGQFQCSGNVLQECSQQAWITVEDCSTNNLICSASSPTACVWSNGTSVSTSLSLPVPTSSSTSGSLSVTSSQPGAAVTSTMSSTSISGSASSAPSSSLSSSGSASAPSASTSASTNSTPHSGSWSAPHYVIYADAWLTQPPDVSTLGQFNRFILSFWMHSGPVDDAQAWQELDASTRTSILDAYHAANVALMVSAFGSTDTPTSSGVDPTQCAQNLAAFVKQYGFDGVDIDYEDFTAFNGGTSEAWLITFQTELRSQLGTSYLISHSPVAPWFSTTAYSAGGYSYIYSKVPDIDFFNIQFYSQGTLYEDCTSLISNSGSSNGTEHFPGTSLLEINSVGGVPLDKLVLGKPLTAADATNGYVDPNTLAGCVSQAKAANWNGGVMFWQWHAASNPPSILSTVIGG